VGGKLIYLMGASGSGKDCLMQYARGKLASTPGICFAHRYITRPADSGGENHVALSREEFSVRRQAGLFALQWESHGLCYGVGIEIDQWLGKGITVVANGSRGYLRDAREYYSGLLPVRIEVAEEVLRERLVARGRETRDQIEKRLERNREFRDPGDQGVVLYNNGPLASAGAELVDIIMKSRGV